MSGGVNQDKKELRRQMLARRQALSPAEAAARSVRIQSHLLVSALFREAACVALYAAFDREVKTDALLAEAWRQDKRVLFPRMKGGGPEMEFCAVQDASEMVASRFGFLEPGPGAPAVSLSAIDLMVVPGLAFDREGFRVGFGGGCYDRVLAALPPETRTCGLAYEFQIVPAVPRSSHDRAVKWLVSEEGFIPIGASR